MRIVAVRDALVPLGSGMRNASIAFDAMTASALALVTDRIVDGKPLVGYAFDSIGRYGKSGLLRERFIPRLLAAPSDSLLDEHGVLDPARCVQAVMANEKPGGHGERPGAVALMEAAAWDCVAKLAGRPLWQVLAERYGTAAPTRRIRVYGSCGHFRPGETLDGLATEVRRARDSGYSLVKIKVGGRSVAEDERRVCAARDAAGADGRIAVDANGMLDPAIAAPWLDAMAQHEVAWVEEPTAPLDYAALAVVAARTPVPLATGENLFSFDDARNLRRYGGLDPVRDRIQVDMLLAYGVAEYARMLDDFTAHGWPHSAFWPHAGHLFAAHCVGAFGLGAAEAAPDATLSYGGYWDDTRVENGLLELPDAPGVGFEHKANLHALLAHALET
jgi:L-alanine-DL-glutamate epimerase-like enolase superfamily enzyme